MDTEKKVQFVALTKEEIDAMIQQAALAGAQVASDAMMVGQRKSEKEKIDRRLHNTDLLLRNYRTLKASYENAVYKSKEGEVTEVLEDIMTMKDDMKAHSNLEEIIQKSVETKGELEDMIKIDKSKMSAEERATYDELIKKFAVETNEDPSIEKKAPQKCEKEENPDVLDDEGAKKKTDTKKSFTPPEQNTDDDIYKGLHPLVREKLEALEKRAEEAEDRELYAVAKKYEVLGEKPEELAKSLKTLKSAGGTAYNDMISILDRNVAMVNNSGVFGEIGKSFSGGTAAVKKSAAEGKIDTIAKGLIEKDPSMPYNMALAKAWEAHPELMAEYEDEAGY